MPRYGKAKSKVLESLKRIERTPFERLTSYAIDDIGQKEKLSHRKLSLGKLKGARTVLFSAAIVAIVIIFNKMLSIKRV